MVKVYCVRNLKNRQNAGAVMFAMEAIFDRAMGSVKLAFTPDSGQSLFLILTLQILRLLTATADGPPGNSATKNKGLSISRTGVLVTAVGENPDGEGTILRLWEQTGKAGKCIVILPSVNKFQTAQACNLRGEPLGKMISIRSGEFEFELGAYKPASFILK